MTAFPRFTRRRLTALALAVMAAGLWLFARGHGAALCFAGVWLLIAWAEGPCQTRKNGIR